MVESNIDGKTIGLSLGGWGKYLLVQLNQMLLGYKIALEFASGEFDVQCDLFGKMREIIGKSKLVIPASSGDKIEDLLNKFFSYYPQTRMVALDRVWHSDEKESSSWVDVHPVFIPRKGWRVVLNGRDLGFELGFDTPVQQKDVLSIFPPGR